MPYACKEKDRHRSVMHLGMVSMRGGQTTRLGSEGVYMGLISPKSYEHHATGLQPRCMMLERLLDALQ